MKLREIMSCNVVTVGLDDRLSTVKEIFDGAGFHHLLVVDGGIVVGVLSDRDLLRAISPNIDTARCTWRDMDTLNKPVHMVMTRKPIVLGPDDDVADLAGVFRHNKISSVPIVDDVGRPVGIVTWRDIMRRFDDIVTSR